ncbi:MAG: hypothetical protein EP330_17725 [Deltaproteobacteria bacterium]|nr:MAG: hypothetical protein EP330_17725 [Deltaproteobacteria bacterium]
MHVDPLEPVGRAEEVTEPRVFPADESAWTPTETLNRQVEPAVAELSPMWAVWFTLMGALGAAALGLAILVVGIAFLG